MTSVPDAHAFWLARARVPLRLLAAPPAGLIADADGTVRLDVRIAGGRVAEIAASVTRAGTGLPIADLEDRHLWPTLVDMHTHIDKSQVIGRIGPLGASFRQAREALNADRAKHWTRADVRARMDFCIRSAYLHGVGAIRTHIDSYEDQAELSWEVFAELHGAWRGRVELQATTSVPIDVYATDHGRHLADLAAATPGGLLGGVLRRSTDHSYGYIEEIDALLDAQFALAKARGLAIDLHVDETLNGNDSHLEHVARAVMRHGLEGRVACSHCCSLAALPESRVEQVLSLCAEAGVGVVTLPITNVYLQDRAAGRTPRLRGVTLVHEIRARRIPLAIATDNVRDSFYPYGDYDMLDTLRQSVGILHLDQDLDAALDAIGPAPARMMGIAPLGTIAVGAPANLIVLNARSLNEVLSRPQADRVVLSNGRVVREQLPAYPVEARS